MRKNRGLYISRRDSKNEHMLDEAICQDDRREVTADDARHDDVGADLLTP